MSFYLDTSVVVAVLVDEAHSSRVVEWLAGVADGELAISDWVVTEISSSLSRKIREGGISEDVRAEALTTFAEFARESLTRHAVVARDYPKAAAYADQHALGLRASDALHLAVTSTAGLTLCTLDKKLAAAGPKVGVPTLLL